MNLSKGNSLVYNEDAEIRTKSKAFLSEIKIFRYPRGAGE